MNLYMHDYARRQHAERIETGHRHEIADDQTTAPLRSLVGNALIMKGEQERTTDLRGEPLPGLKAEEAGESEEEKTDE